MHDVEENLNYQYKVHVTTTCLLCSIPYGKNACFSYANNAWNTMSCALHVSLNKKCTLFPYVYYRHSHSKIHEVTWGCKLQMSRHMQSTCKTHGNYGRKHPRKLQMSRHMKIIYVKRMKKHVASW